MKLLTIALLSLSVSAQAAEISVEHGIFTKHFRYDPRMNEQNRFNAIELRLDGYGFNASAFNNTYGNDTKTAGAYYTVFERKYIEVDLMYGVVNGYTQEQLGSLCSNDNCLYVAPRVTLKHGITDKTSVKLSAQMFGNAIMTTVGLRYSF